MKTAIPSFLHALVMKTASLRAFPPVMKTARLRAFPPVMKTARLRAAIPALVLFALAFLCAGLAPSVASAATIAHLQPISDDVDEDGFAEAASAASNTTTVTTNADYVAGENSQALITAEARAAALALLGDKGDALIHALELTMAKYDRDMATPTGRRSWHGKLCGEEFDTNLWLKIETYTNTATGASWRYAVPWRKESRSATVRAANARLKATVTTNGIPAALAAARLRRAAEAATTNTVSVVVNAN